MPKTTVEKLNETRVKLTVAITIDELEPHLKKAYKTISEQVSIPGFRKGKAPAQIIDQRFGREAVVSEAVNHSLDDFYQGAVAEAGIRPMGRPSADIDALPEGSNDVVLTFEVEVRPELKLPKYDGMKIVVDDVEVDEDAVEHELTHLRERFGTLVTVDRPAAKGDFVQLDLQATIEGVEVDSASNISYELGSGELIEGIDEAIDSLTAGESTSFDSVLLGGDNEGQTALIAVTVTAVKERELPAIDDDFAQLASPFDTVEELRADLREQAARAKQFEVGAQARDKFLETLLEQVEIPVPAKLVEDEVHRHLDGEGRLEDAEHRAEVTEASEKQFRNQILLDTIAEHEEVQVSREELTNYLVRASSQYGMSPNDFIKTLSEGGQIPAMVGEVARSKAIVSALGKAKVVDAKGKAVDISDFVAAVLGDGSGEPVFEDEHAGHDHDDHEGHSH